MNCDGKAVHQTTTEVFLLLKIVWDVSCVTVHSSAQEHHQKAALYW